MSGLERPRRSRDRADDTDQDSQPYFQREDSHLPINNPPKSFRPPAGPGKHAPLAKRETTQPGLYSQPLNKPRSPYFQHRQNSLIPVSR